MKKLIILILSTLFIAVGAFPQEKWLDSVVTYNYSSEYDSVIHTKEEYGYDANSNLNLVISYKWYNHNVWGGWYKREYAYDSNGNLKQESYYWWNFVIMIGGDYINMRMLLIHPET